MLNLQEPGSKAKESEAFLEDESEVWVLVRFLLLGSLWLDPVYPVSNFLSNCQLFCQLFFAIQAEFLKQFQFLLF